MLEIDNYSSVNNKAPANSYLVDFSFFEPDLNFQTTSTNTAEQDSTLEKLTDCKIVQNDKLKRKRGRPPLEHCSPPTLEQLKNADPSKRKYLEQRYKNNEASRISRRKRKLNEEQLKLEEQQEIERNRILKLKHMKLKKKHEFLKEYLRIIVMRS